VGFQLLESPVNFGFRLVDLRPEFPGLMTSNLPASLDLDFHVASLWTPQKEKPDTAVRTVTGFSSRRDSPGVPGYPFLIRL
jgi:hypothetical protein